MSIFLNRYFLNISGFNFSFVVLKYVRELQFRCVLFQTKEARFKVRYVFVLLKNS